MLSTHMDFSVVRSSHCLVKPCEKTPAMTLELSGMDKVPVLRCNARTLHVYKQGQSEFQSQGHGSSAASIAIRKALSRALVAYYPLAGRLKESSQGDLQVECCGQGVLFVEASANCTLDVLDYLDQAYAAPISYLDLLPNQLIPTAAYKEASDEPLIQMQVTEFACGGFVIGMIFSHTICDGLGSAQFLNAVGEFARGLDHLSVTPVWCRDFFISSSQPKFTTSSPQPPPVLPVIPTPNYRLEQANVDISMEQIEKLKHKFQHSTGRRCSTFEIVTAGFWSCRTRAISSSSGSSSNGELVKFVFFANCRQLVKPPLAKGFYGNCFFPLTVTAPKETVARASVEEVVKLVQEAKADLPKKFDNYINNKNHNNSNGTEEAADGGPGDADGDGDPFFPPMSYDTLFVSEWGRLGFNEVDFGWGPPMNIIPIQGSPIIPAAIVGWQPKKRGIRLMTWCVEEAHRRTFLHHITQLFLS